ncbi:MAG: type I DNA topoisomerase [Chloroflexi bacterium]|nr:type I DNA topoisomerase [Chloroflexota bacterium]MCL5074816.1 type I DNA topoisomerase [Chloroflexota bacterium]
MAKKLVIVESPAKARTIGRFLGSEYTVRASIGHIRDLPSNRLGVDIDNGFTPHYVVPEKKKQVVQELKGYVREASDVYLATDPDREGEAISWHLVNALRIQDKAIHRVEFHEITAEAITAAFAYPREINMQLVDAQQARRILDRLVGYKLSPLLRRKVMKKGLSAGRVQSVALRLIVEREREIESFVPQEYWSIEAELAKRREDKRRGKRERFKASLQQIDGHKIEIKNEAEAKAILSDLEGASYIVAEVRKKDVQRNPAPPFTTSTMQQEASRKLGFTAKKTMAVAQQLYEGLPIGAEGNVGLITYMRTDSTNIAPSAIAEARSYITEHFGQNYVPSKPRFFRGKVKGAQEAHEGIRPTSIARSPEAIKPYLSSDQYKLYRLIWQRMVASQMAAAVMESTSIDIQASNGSHDRRYLFRATGSVVKFPGFTVLYMEARDEDKAENEQKALPPLAKGELLDLLALLPEQHFTQPPPRYTEATLVKALEEYGIGRPSTYAPILSTIQERGYVERIDKRLNPTSIGFIVNDLLVGHFPEIINVSFTAQMEAQLDEIAQGARQWVHMIRQFYTPFEALLQRAEQRMERVELMAEPTGEICEKCGGSMVIKYGRFGKFIGCANYPRCRNAKPLAVKIGVKCPECGADLVEKKTRRKRTFYGCSRYPQCSFGAWNKPLPDPCPQCGGLLTLAGKDGIRCLKCGYVTAGLPEAEPIVVG